jgi:tetrahydromethanopterin S-methyltransferase subunit G
MSAGLLLSLLLLTTPFQSIPDSVLSRRVEELEARNEELETRIEELEARVSQHEIAEGYFDSILSNERTWWTVLITLIVASVGGFTYYKFHERVRKVTEEFEGMRGRLDEIESEFYTTQAMVYKNYSVRNRKQHPIKAFRDQIDALDSLRKSGDITEVDKRTIEGDLKHTIQCLTNAIRDGYCIEQGFYSLYSGKISEIGSFLGEDFEELTVSVSRKLSEVEICDEDG